MDNETISTSRASSTMRETETTGPVIHSAVRQRRDERLDKVQAYRKCRSNSVPKTRTNEKDELSPSAAQDRDVTSTVVCDTASIRFSTPQSAKVTFQAKLIKRAAMRRSTSVPMNVEQMPESSTVKTCPEKSVQSGYPSKVSQSSYSKHLKLEQEFKHANQNTIDPNSLSTQPEKVAHKLSTGNETLTIGSSHHRERSRVAALAAIPKGKVTITKSNYATALQSKTNNICPTPQRKDHKIPELYSSLTDSKKQLTTLSDDDKTIRPPVNKGLGKSVGIDPRAIPEKRTYSNSFLNDLSNETRKRSSDDTLVPCQKGYGSEDDALGKIKTGLAPKLEARSLKVRKLVVKKANMAAHDIKEIQSTLQNDDTDSRQNTKHKRAHVVAQYKEKNSLKNDKAIDGKNTSETETSTLKIHPVPTSTKTTLPSHTIPRKSRLQTKAAIDCESKDSIPSDAGTAQSKKENFTKGLGTRNIQKALKFSARDRKVRRSLGGGVDSTAGKSVDESVQFFPNYDSEQDDNLLHSTSLDTSVYSQGSQSISTEPQVSEDVSLNSSGLPRNCNEGILQYANPCANELPQEQPHTTIECIRKGSSSIADLSTEVTKRSISQTEGSHQTEKGLVYHSAIGVNLDVSKESQVSGKCADGEIQQYIRGLSSGSDDFYVGTKQVTSASMNTFGQNYDLDQGIVTANNDVAAEAGNPIPIALSTDSDGEIDGKRGIPYWEGLLYLINETETQDDVCHIDPRTDTLTSTNGSQFSFQGVAENADICITPHAISSAKHGINLNNALRSVSGTVNDNHPSLEMEASLYKDEGVSSGENVVGNPVGLETTPVVDTVVIEPCDLFWSSYFEDSSQPYFSQSDSFFDRKTAGTDTASMSAKSELLEQGILGEDLIHKTTVSLFVDTEATSLSYQDFDTTPKHTESNNPSCFVGLPVRGIEERCNQSEESNYNSTENIQEPSFDFRPCSADFGGETSVNDPSWDINRVFFSEFQLNPRKKASKNDIDPLHVETSTAASVVIDHLQSEEKKEKDEDSVPFMNDFARQFDPTGWPIQIDNLGINPDISSPADASDIMETFNDEENLLGRFNYRATYDCRDLAEAERLKLERISMYSTGRSDDSSHDPDDTDKEHESMESDEDPQDVGYVSQVSDDEDKDVEVRSSWCDRTEGDKRFDCQFLFDNNDFHNIEMSQDATDNNSLFSASEIVQLNIIAQHPNELGTSRNIAPVEVLRTERNDIVKDTVTIEDGSLSFSESLKCRDPDVCCDNSCTLDSLQLIERATETSDFNAECPILSHPPPPPPVSKPLGTKKRRAKHGSTGERIPLIDPIPEEKYHRWLENAETELACRPAVDRLACGDPNEVIEIREAKGVNNQSTELTDSNTEIDSCAKPEPVWMAAFPPPPPPPYSKKRKSKRRSKSLSTPTSTIPPTIIYDDKNEDTLSHCLESSEATSKSVLESLPFKNTNNDTLTESICIDNDIDLRQRKDNVLVVQVCDTEIRKTSTDLRGYQGLELSKTSEPDTGCLDFDPLKTGKEESVPERNCMNLDSQRQPHIFLIESVNSIQVQENHQEENSSTGFVTYVESTKTSFNGDTLEVIRQKGMHVNETVRDIKLNVNIDKNNVVDVSSQYAAIGSSIDSVFEKCDTEPLSKSSPPIPVTKRQIIQVNYWNIDFEEAPIENPPESPNLGLAANVKVTEQILHTEPMAEMTPLPLGLHLNEVLASKMSVNLFDNDGLNVSAKDPALGLSSTHSVFNQSETQALLNSSPPIPGAEVPMIEAHYRHVDFEQSPSENPAECTKLYLATNVKAPSPILHTEPTSEMIPNIPPPPSSKKRMKKGSTCLQTGLEKHIMQPILEESPKSLPEISVGIAIIDKVTSEEVCEKLLLDSSCMNFSSKLNGDQHSERDLESSHRQEPPLFTTSSSNHDDKLVERQNAQHGVVDSSEKFVEPTESLEPKSPQSLEIPDLVSSGVGTPLEYTSPIVESTKIISVGAVHGNPTADANELALTSQTSLEFSSDGIESFNNEKARHECETTTVELTQDLHYVPTSQNPIFTSKYCCDNVEAGHSSEVEDRQVLFSAQSASTLHETNERGLDELDPVAISSAYSEAIEPMQKGLKNLLIAENVREQPVEEYLNQNVLNTDYSSALEVLTSLAMNLKLSDQCNSLDALSGSSEDPFSAALQDSDSASSSELKIEYSVSISLSPTKTEDCGNELSNLSSEAAAAVVDVNSIDPDSSSNLLMDKISALPHMDARSGSDKLQGAVSERLPLGESLIQPIESGLGMIPKFCMGDSTTTAFDGHIATDQVHESPCTDLLSPKSNLAKHSVSFLRKDCDTDQSENLQENTTNASAKNVKICSKNSQFFEHSLSSKFIEMAGRKTDQEEHLLIETVVDSRPFLVLTDDGICERKIDCEIETCEVSSMISSPSKTGSDITLPRHDQEPEEAGSSNQADKDTSVLELRPVVENAICGIVDIKDSSSNEILSILALLESSLDESYVVSGDFRCTPSAESMTLPSEPMRNNTTSADKDLDCSNIDANNTEPSNEDSKKEQIITSRTGSCWPIGPCETKVDSAAFLEEFGNQPTKGSVVGESSIQGQAERDSQSHSGDVDVVSSTSKLKVSSAKNHIDVGKEAFVRDEDKPEFDVHHVNATDLTMLEMCDLYSNHSSKSPANHCNSPRVQFSQDAIILLDTPKECACDAMEGSVLGIMIAAPELKPTSPQRQVICHADGLNGCIVLDEACQKFAELVSDKGFRDTSHKPLLNNPGDHFSCEQYDAKQSENTLKDCSHSAGNLQPEYARADLDLTSMDPLHSKDIEESNDHSIDKSSESFDRDEMLDRSFRPFRATRREGNEVDEIWGEGGYNFECHEHGSLEGEASMMQKETLLSTVLTAGSSQHSSGHRYIVPYGEPSPFSAAVRVFPRILSLVLDYIGDPVFVCRMKMVDKACFHYIDCNEQKLLRDAVRLGAMNMNVRPYFWIWVTLQRAAAPARESGLPSNTDVEVCDSCGEDEFRTLESHGKAGKWHYVISRDVPRAFGNLPPHKTGARLRTDSIVRALVTWGRNRTMKRGLKGAAEAPLLSVAESTDCEEGNAAPMDRVSDWGGVTPVGSFSGSFASSISGTANDDEGKARFRRNQTRDEDLALNGNVLTEDTKLALQDKLSFILHALAAAHPEVGYCQGMDYVVAHLLRILKETILWKAANGTLPRTIKCTPWFHEKPEGIEDLALVYEEMEKSLVVEETCFQVMDTFFTVYNLQHFYWPELRCLKTCCRVFEKIIQIKLPVLADHFEHHELNVGLFALGWFQTLFLYLPSMPSATVCHMWDIWLVERSYKIFFRVGTAILFLSQPILLNFELEGMMNYLNTFPDATLLSPDILIACALQIKITNRILMELEQEVVDQTTF